MFKNLKVKKMLFKSLMLSSLLALVASQQLRKFFNFAFLVIKRKTISEKNPLEMKKFLGYNFLLARIVMQMFFIFLPIELQGIIHWLTTVLQVDFTSQNKLWLIVNRI